jgi:hypothetical protein
MTLRLLAGGDTEMNINTSISITMLACSVSQLSFDSILQNHSNGWP